MPTPAPAHTTPTFLIASDSANDAALVEQLLGDEFGKIFTSINPDKAAKDFDRPQPGVLVLESVRALNAMAENIRPTIVVVDDAENSAQSPSSIIHFQIC